MGGGAWWRGKRERGVGGLEEVDRCEYTKEGEKCEMECWPSMVVDGPSFCAPTAVFDSRISYLETPEVPTLGLSSLDRLRLGFGNMEHQTHS